MWKSDTSFELLYGDYYHFKAVLYVHSFPAVPRDAGSCFHTSQVETTDQ